MQMSKVPRHQNNSEVLINQELLNWIVEAHSTAHQLNVYHGLLQDQAIKGFVELLELLSTIQAQETQILNSYYPSQQIYLRIVKELASQRGLAVEREDLEFQALEWARWYNGISGRTARQFVDQLTAKIRFQK